MADMRDALKKAGMVSDKQIRQTKHQDRVKRKELGLDGLEAERQKRDDRYREEQSKKKHTDKKTNLLKAASQVDLEKKTALKRIIKEENILAREGGNKRFYFQLPDGTIPFIEISPILGKRLAQGDAAIVDSEQILIDDFAVLSGKAAHQLSALEQERIIFWNVKRQS